MQNFPPVQDLIPQRAPFVMIDKILAADETSFATTFTVPADNLLTHEGEFTESGLIENIAQSAAAEAGYRNKEQSLPKIGVIGAVKKFNLVKRPKAGSKLTTRVSKIAEFENASVVEGVVLQEGTIIASCQLNIFILNDPKF